MIAKREVSSSPGWLSIAFSVLAIGLGITIGLLVFNVTDTLKVFIIALGVLLVGFSLMRVEFGLLLLIFITFTRFSDVLVHYHHLPSIAQPFIALLWAMVILRWLVTGSIPGGWTRPALLMGFYGVVIFSSLLYASNFSSALSGFVVYLKDSILAILIITLLQRKTTLRWVIWALLGAGIFMGTLSVYQFVSGSFGNNFYGFAQSSVKNIVGGTEANRIAGPIGDPNFYAMVMVVLIPLAFSRFWGERRLLLRLLAGWALVVCLLTVVFTFSRGGFLALLVTTLTLMIYYPPKPSQLVIGLLVLAALIPFVPSTYRDRMSTMLNLRQNTTTEASLRGRASGMLVSLRMFIERPILGVGFANYNTHYQEYAHRAGLTFSSDLVEPHDLYLEIAAETGLAGLFAVGMILWTILKGLMQAWRKYKEAGLVQDAAMVSSITIALIGYLSASLFIHGAYPRYFWLLCGIAFSIPAIVDNEMSSQKSLTG